MIFKLLLATVLHHGHDKLKGRAAWWITSTFIQGAVHFQ